MEADGLITRRTDPGDNRFMLVKLTEAGRERQAEVALKLNKIKSTLMQGLSSEELLSMQRTLERIRQNAESLIGGSARNIFPGEDNF